MNRLSPKQKIVVGSLAGLLCLALASAVLAAAAKAGQPTSVVTVNLGAVIEKLDQRNDSDIGLRALLDKLQKDDKAQQDDLKKMQDDAKLLKEDSKERLDAQEKIAMATLKYQAWVRYGSDAVDIEKALIAQDIYRSIKIAVAQMASSAGYDIVLVDDSQGELSTTSDSRVPRENQIGQQIAARRLLYVNPSIDITEELITRMNNAHKAGANATPANNAPAASGNSPKKP